MAIRQNISLDFFLQQEPRESRCRVCVRVCVNDFPRQQASMPNVKGHQSQIHAVGACYKQPHSQEFRTQARQSKTPGRSKVNVYPQVLFQD